MKPNKLSIAVTGGIGSGKSEVCQLIAGKGIPVFSADTMGHQALLRKDVKAMLIAEFGDSILKDGEIDRIELGKTAFCCKEKTELLNSIVHPAVIDEIHKEIDNHPRGITVFEIPLLFEAQLQNLFDIIIMVFADESVRLSRVLSRSGMTRKKFTEITAAQYDQKKARLLADYVLENSGDKEELALQLDNILKKICGECKK